MILKVNGIIASPFDVSHTLANVFYRLHYFIKKSFPRSIVSLNQFRLADFIQFIAAQIIKQVGSVKFSHLAVYANTSTAD